MKAPNYFSQCNQFTKFLRRVNQSISEDASFYGDIRAPQNLCKMMGDKNLYPSYMHASRTSSILMCFGGTPIRRPCLCLSERFAMRFAKQIFFRTHFFSALLIRHKKWCRLSIKPEHRKSATVASKYMCIYIHV